MAKILIVRLGAMGDILHALPAVTGIRAALPDATIGWLVEERWTDLLAAGGNKPVVNLIHAVNTRRWRSALLHSSIMREVLSARKAIRSLHYDVALDFQGAIKSAWFARLTGASRRAGFVNPRETAARFFYSEKFSRSGEHVIEQNHALAAQALKKYLDGKSLKLLPPQLPRDPAAESWADAEIGKLGIASFAIMNPGAGWGAKQWPPERYGQVAQALARHNLKTLVNASRGEEPLAQAVIQASEGHAFTVSCTIGQLIALTRRARLFLGGDTGPLHLAAALGIPVVGLFGPTDPARTGPFGTGAVALRHQESKTTFSHHKHPDEGLLKITVDEVVSAARHLLRS
ncbi:MAG TPA: lipopolysaccharide heptosyltransferase I [Candidatus Angelobacter sp.]